MELGSPSTTIVPFNAAPPMKINALTISPGYSIMDKNLHKGSQSRLPTSARFLEIVRHICNITVAISDGL